jgi:hypothetical protein
MSIFSSVFILSRNVFIVILMNIFYHFTLYFPLCFLLLSFLISSFFFTISSLFLSLFQSVSPKRPLKLGF